MEDKLTRGVSAYVYIVLIFQLLFYFSGPASMFFNIEINLLGLWLNIAYSTSISICTLYLLIKKNDLIHKSLVTAAISCIIMSYFAPGISAIFLASLLICSKVVKEKSVL
jgi:hypothetical protein